MATRHAGAPSALAGGAALLSLLWLAAPAASEVTAEQMVRSAHGESQPAAAPGGIERAIFTTAVIEREPQDEVAELGNENTQVFFFTELLDREGETLTHRWVWNGQVMAEVDFEVGSARWRTWSSKNLEPSWLGEWTVSVLDASEQVISTASFTYTSDEAVAAEAPQPRASRAAAAAPAAPAPAAPAAAAAPAAPAAVSPIE